MDNGGRTKKKAGNWRNTINKTFVDEIRAETYGKIYTLG